MQLQYLNLPWVIAAAGGDPWQVDLTLQSGNPAVVDELAQAFHNAGSCTAESSAAFAEARRRFQAAWNRENGEHPINGSAEVQRATTTLHLQQIQLTAIGTDLEGIAAALAEAQKSAAEKVNALQAQLQAIDDRIGILLAHDVDADVSELLQIAADDTAGILHQLEKLRDDAEVAARAFAINSFADRLRNSGVSSGGVQQAITAIKNGMPPSEFFNQLSNASGSVGKGLETYGVAGSPVRHSLDPGAFTKADAEALTKFGKILGRAGTGLDGLLTAMDVVNGKVSLTQGAAEFGGRWAGGATGAWTAGLLVSLLVAPEIAVPFAVAGGMIGGSMLGQGAVDKVLGY